MMLELVVWTVVVIVSVVSSVFVVDVAKAVPDGGEMKTNTPTKSTRIAVEPEIKAVRLFTFIENIQDKEPFHAI